MADQAPRASEAPARRRTEGDLSPAWPAGPTTKGPDPGVADRSDVDLKGRPTNVMAAQQGARATPPATTPPMGPEAAAVGERRQVYVGVSPLRRTAQMVWLLWFVSELIVGLRVIFAGLAANPNSGFVSFINGISGPLVDPFRSIMRERAIGTNGILEPSALIAMVMFFAGALIVAMFLRILAAPRVRPAAEQPIP